MIELNQSCFQQLFNALLGMEYNRIVKLLLVLRVEGGLRIQSGTALQDSAMQKGSVIKGFTDNRVPSCVTLGNLIGPAHQQVEGEANWARLANRADLSQMPSLKWHHHEDVCIGDFQERCHPWAATQAARINVNSRASSFSSGGLLIHTSSGWSQQRVLRLQRVGLARRAAS